MDMQDKDRYERIRETLGDWCGMVELARVEEADAMKWLVADGGEARTRSKPDAARELADALGARHDVDGERTGEAAALRS